MRYIAATFLLLLFSCGGSKGSVIIFDPVGAELNSYLPDRWSTQFEVVAPENFSTELAEQYSANYEKIIVSRWLYAYSPAGPAIQKSERFISLDDIESSRSVSFAFNLENLNDFLPYYDEILIIKTSGENFLGAPAEGVRIIEEKDYTRDLQGEGNILLVAPSSIKMYDVFNADYKGDILIQNGILFYDNFPNVIGSIFRDLNKIRPFLQENPSGGNIALSIELRQEGKRFDKELTRKYNSK